MHALARRFGSLARPLGAVVLLAGLVVGCANDAAAPEPEAAGAAQVSEDWSGFGILENVLKWTPEQQLRGYRNMDRIYPTRPIAASDDPFPLPSRLRETDGLSYEVEGERFDINGFAAHNNVVGILVIKNGTVVLERYDQGNLPSTRWYSFSVAKSVVSLLIGAAVQDGYIESLDMTVDSFLPLLRGSAYEGVTIRQAMQMSSGVAWNEDYTSPDSDLVKTGGSALNRLRYLSELPRAAAPGTEFNYSTGETNLLGAVLRSAIGNNLSTYLQTKIWTPFGMEHDAHWLLLAEGGGEHGGCCLSASLRDYGRIGLFAMRNGELRDGTQVLPEGWMAESTAPSPARERYGYLWWLGEDGVYNASGIFGQAIHINPAQDLVVVTHSAWPQATGGQYSRHRTAFFDAVTTWAR